MLRFIFIFKQSREVGIKNTGFPKWGVFGLKTTLIRAGEPKEPLDEKSVATKKLFGSPVP